MLVTERTVRATRIAPVSVRSFPVLPSLSRAVAWARAAGSLRAWLCLGLTGYVLGVAALNLLRFGIER
ncbi:MAG TPA: hypothetical protein VNT60_00895 [Deinococcales bacterium]|nr:hypothetical protein [Deinococcales bacterium]